MTATPPATEPDGQWAVLVEKNLSDHFYGAHIHLTDASRHAQARADFDAISAGRRPDILSIPAGARIVDIGPDQCGVVVDHRLRSPELTRISLTRLRP